MKPKEKKKGDVVRKKEDVKREKTGHRVARLTGRKHNEPKVK